MKMKHLKSWLLGLVAMCIPFLGSATNTTAEERFYIPDFKISAGETKQVAIQFECNKEYVAFQFNIHLPEGLAPATSAFGGYKFSFNPARIIIEGGQYSHSISSALQSDGSIKVVGSSMYNLAFQGTTGDFVYLDVTASEDFSGTHEITLSDIKFSTVSGELTELPDVTAQVTAPEHGEASLEITSDNQWATGIYPFATELPEGVSAFSCEALDGEYLELSEVSSIEANTPYILYAENGYQGTLSGEIVPTEDQMVTEGLLSGALAEQAITSGYVLQNQGSGCMFYKVKEELTIPAGKCWLNIASPLKVISISRGTTGIDATVPVMNSEEVYTLDGKRVTNPQPGNIYVVNGEKVIKL